MTDIIDSIQPEPKRKKFGGRKKGTPNKVNAVALDIHKLAMEKLQELFTHDGKMETPLQFFINSMNDPKKDYRDRLDAAKAAAPYIHQQPARAVEVSGLDEGPLFNVIIPPADANTL